MNVHEMESTVRSIAEKCAKKLEARIDAAERLEGEALKDVHEGVQTLGYLVATLERLGRLRNGRAAKPYTEEDLIKAVTANMFSTFVQPATRDISAEAHG